MKAKHYFRYWNVDSDDATTGKPLSLEELMAPIPCWLGCRTLRSTIYAKGFEELGIDGVFGKKVTTTSFTYTGYTYTSLIVTETYKLTSGTVRAYEKLIDDLTYSSGDILFEGTTYDITDNTGSGGGTWSPSSPSLGSVTGTTTSITGTTKTVTTTYSSGATRVVTTVYSDEAVPSTLVSEVNADVDYDWTTGTPKSGWSRIPNLRTANFTEDPYWFCSPTPFTSTSTVECSVTRVYAFGVRDDPQSWIAFKTLVNTGVYGTPTQQAMAGSPSFKLTTDDIESSGSIQTTLDPFDTQTVPQLLSSPLASPIAKFDARQGAAGGLSQDYRLFVSMERSGRGYAFYDTDTDIDTLGNYIEDFVEENPTF